jgi:RimJ/RimL family protein N-acetyltransferase
VITKDKPEETQFQISVFIFLNKVQCLVNSGVMALFENYIRIQSIKLDRISKELKDLESRFNNIKVVVERDIPEKLITKYLYLDNKAKQALPAIYTKNDYMSLEQFKAKLDRRVQVTKYFYVLAFDEAGRLIGKLNSWLLGSNLYMDLLYVLEDFRKKKIGTQLVYKTLLTATEQGQIKKISLSTEGENSAAVRILNKLGEIQHPETV